MNNSNKVWGSLLQSNQPVWATPEVRKVVENLNKNKVRGNLKIDSAKRPKNTKVVPSTEFDDPLFTDRNIRKYGTDIYFLDAIDDETQLILQQMLKQCVAEFLGEHIQEILTQSLNDAITIYINSPGGYAYCGLALYDFIKELQVPIRCVVTGMCASAATLILLACENRDMSESSVFLMHQCSWGAWGDNRYMQDEAENSRKLMARLREIYMKETDIGKEYTDEKEREAYIQSILEHDRYFSKDECSKLGILREDEDDQPLSAESLAKLNEFAQKLFDQEKKSKEKKVPAKKTTTEKKVPVKKTTKRTKKE